MSLPQELTQNQEDNVEEHHITPVSYGGPQEGPTVFLHSDCHYNIHKTAESILGKTVKSKI